MKITHIKPFLAGRYLLVRVYTDEGLIGNGEAGLWAHHKTVFHAIQELETYYVGKDPARIEHHFQVVSRNTHFMGAVLSAAMSAIDIALWDILAKSVNLPVYQMLGGKCRNKVKVFTNVSGGSVEVLAESARKGVSDGFTSLRMTPFFPGFEQKTATALVSEAVSMVATVRDAVGDHIDLGLEIHRNLNPDAAIMLATELRPFKILYYEDPLAPESIEALEYISRHIDLPMATGERFYSIFQFKDLIDRKIVSLIRPDLSLAGGFTQVKKVASIAEPAFVGIFPHLMGSPVNNAAFAHLGMAIPNYAHTEANPHEGILAEIVDEPFSVENGYRMVPDRPGIGVEIDESVLERIPYEPASIAGSFHGDGSVAH